LIATNISCWETIVSTQYVPIGSEYLHTIVPIGNEYLHTIVPIGNEYLHTIVPIGNKCLHTNIPVGIDYMHTNVPVVSECSYTIVPDLTGYWSPNEIDKRCPIVLLTDAPHIRSSCTLG